MLTMCAFFFKSYSGKKLKAFLYENRDKVRYKDTERERESETDRETNRDR